MTDSEVEYALSVLPHAYHIYIEEYDHNLGLYLWKTDRLLQARQHIPRVSSIVIWAAEPELSEESMSRIIRLPTSLRRHQKVSPCRIGGLP